LIYVRLSRDELQAPLYIGGVDFFNPQMEQFVWFNKM